MVDRSMPVSAAADAAPHTEGSGDVLVPPGTGERWTVLHTLSRREKCVAGACERFSVRHYLPLRPGRIATRSRERALVPLFPGYVFACLGCEGGRRVLEGGSIARILPVQRPEVLLAELRRIRLALEAGAGLLPADGFHRGRWVRVTAGPLRDLTGEIADRRARRGTLRLILNISMLGRGATVEIDPGDVELLPMLRETRAAPVSGHAYPSPHDKAARSMHSPSGTV